MKIRLLILPVIILGFCGCSTMYYGTMEKLGVHKREIMVDRVKAARDTQNGVNTELPKPDPLASYGKLSVFAAGRDSAGPLL